MNKRHYEHTLPNIRGSLSNTYHNTMFLMLMNQNLFLELVLVVLVCPMYFSSDKRI